jgi:arylsulfatase A-like enzyme
VLPEQAVLPAEILSKAGFQTVGIYRNGWVAPTFGFAQGFEVYKRPSSRPLPATVKRANPTLTDQDTDDGAIDAALEFLRIDGRKRWFLYLHLMDVHEYLYDKESALFGSDHLDIYDNSIRHIDHLIEVLVDSLSEAGYRENTLIVIAADHGEAFGERGFDGHAREVYRETTEVPFLLSFPFRIEPGITVRSTTRNVDIWPTVLDLLGLAPPDGVDGRSLAPEIEALARGEVVADEAPAAIAHLDQTWGRPELAPSPTIAVVEDEHRYVRTDQPDGTLEQIFDRRDDPGELRERAAEQPETLERLRQTADRYLEGHPSWGDSPTRQIDELELNQLRALGYQIP